MNFAIGSRVLVLASATGRFDGRIGRVIEPQGVALVRVEFNDGERATFWHEDLRAA